jgi:hypothetical protein
MNRFNTLSVASFLIASFAPASPLFAQCQTAKLTGEPLEAYAQYGRSVAISGNRIVVGSIYQDAPGAHDSGAAYVYELSGGVWSLQGTLFAHDAADFDEFGVSVAIDGDTIVVGADAVDGPLSGAVGAAYFFHWNGSQWVETQKVQASDGAPGGFFGCAVTLEGDTAVIGRFWDSATGSIHAGSAYVFTRNAGTWTESQKLAGSNPHREDDFGYALALSGNRIVVGAPERFSDGPADIQLGKAYVFERNGSTWAQSALLLPTNPQAYDQFGISVDIDGDELVVGAWQELFSDMFGGDGEAYIFDWNGSAWNQSQILVGSDPHHNDEFGGAVSIQGSNLVVGAASHDAYPLWGAVYTFAKSAGSWTETSLLLPQPNSSLSWLGNAVALDGNHAVSGAYIETYGVYQSGTAYVFGGFAPWTDEGFALAGTSGDPVLAGTGSLCDGTFLSLLVSNARPHARVVLISGNSATYTPFHGGTLVPAPQRIRRGLATDASGSVAIDGVWPPNGLPAGSTLFFQVWIRDPAGPQGWAATNALSGVAP